MVFCVSFEALYFWHFPSFYTMQLEPPKNGEVCGPMETYGDLWGTMEAYEGQCGPWGPMETKTGARGNPFATGEISPCKGGGGKCPG